jgi:CheY-like chemotaxis protein
MMLAKIGCVVELACNGDEALKMLAVHPFDAVLMDCQMPVMNGYDATRQIRAGQLPGVNPSIPVIALTALAMAGDEEKCKVAGMTDFITKPMRLPDVRSALERCGLNTSALVSEREKRAMPPRNSIIDYKHVAEMRSLRGEHSLSLWTEILAAFDKETQESLQVMNHEAEQQNWEALSATSHRFAGNCAIVGGPEMKSIALTLEKLAIQRDGEAIAARLVELRSAVDRFHVLTLASVNTG